MSPYRQGGDLSLLERDVLAQVRLKQGDNPSVLVEGVPDNVYEALLQLESRELVTLFCHPATMQMHAKLRIS